jgi:hypothetical protein
MFYRILHSIFIDILVSLTGIVVTTTEPVEDFSFCFLYGHDEAALFLLRFSLLLQFP